MILRLTPLFSAILLLEGCATTIPVDVDRLVSMAYADPGSTELGRFFQAEISAHPGESGVVLVPIGEWGFRARAGLANQAGKTIDVQNYIWETDTAGSLLAERLMRAADLAG
jgi:putative cardiolipin synthase